jgi:hypothetical protein
MPSVRNTKGSHDSSKQVRRRLPQRWALIFTVAAMAAVSAAAVAGLPDAITVFFVVAGVMHKMME